VRRLWLRWAGLVIFVVVLGVVFINLGEWQLDRLDQRRARNQATVTNEARAVRPMAEVFGRPISETDQWQRVEAQGTFEADHQFVVRYRHNGDAEGYEVVTPLRTSAGVVLVDRGFVATGQGARIPTAVPPPPGGEVTVVGHVRRNEHGRRSAIDPVNGQMRLINSDAVAAVLGYPVLNGYIGLLQVTPPQSGEFVPVELPELSEGPHFWYAVQWFMFTGFALAGIVIFIRGDLRDRRLELARAAGPVTSPEAAQDRI
jgi:cytochrome oxidase assembly protein ShyY1